MQLPLQIAFRDVEPTAAIEAAIRDRALRLDKFASHIMTCRVVVGLAGKHRLHGDQFEIHVDVTLAGGEVVATREPGPDAGYKDVAVAIRDAFDAAGRQIEDFVRCQRGSIKQSSRPPHAKISKLMPQKDCGFLTAADGREIYFHRNSVINGAFDRLQVGNEVAFAEEEGDLGPQASTVKLVGRHGRRT